MTTNQISSISLQDPCGWAGSDFSMCCDDAGGGDTRWREPTGNNCGRSDQLFRILGGSSANTGRWGWAASLRKH